MALTPEQVLNKHFQTTQFRRGYEERDVDFLDEIVAEMRSLIEQRDDYLKQLNDCRASKSQPAVRSDGPHAGDATGAGRGRVTTPSSERSRRRSRTPSGPSRLRRTGLRRRRPRRMPPSVRRVSASSRPRATPSEAEAAARPPSARRHSTRRSRG